MKLLPRSLLGRTALYLGIILVVGSVGWTAAIGYFLVRPLGELYGQMVGDTILIARPLLERDGVVPQRLSGKLVSMRIVADTGPLPKFRESSRREFPPDIFERLRTRLGDDTGLEQEQDSKDVWIRFRAGRHFYWLAVHVNPPAAFPPPILIWVGGGFAMSIGGAYLIIYRLGRRLRHVAEAARAFGHGQVTPALEETGPQEIQDLSASFNQMASDLQRHESERRLMLAGISHDLRTPLTRLRLATEFIETKTDPQLAAGMIHDIEELDSILKQFLDYARDGSEEAPAEADLNGIIREVCQRYARGGHRIALELGEVPAFVFRPLALRRVVTNLVENAVRYGRDSVEVRTSCAGDRVRLDVSDRGPGVAPERLKEIGRPFVRESQARSELGAGLGLAIVDRIVRAHGGRLELLNRPQGGFLARIDLTVGSAVPRQR